MFSTLSMLWSGKPHDRLTKGKIGKNSLLKPGETLPLYSRSEVSNHCHPDSCWIILHNYVCDVTQFLQMRLHPGGEDILLENGGRDATIPFEEVGHSLDALMLMEKYCIGLLIEKDRTIRNRRSSVLGP